MRLCFRLLQIPGYSNAFIHIFSFWPLLLPKLVKQMSSILESLIKHWCLEINGTQSLLIFKACIKINDTPKKITSHQRDINFSEFSKLKTLQILNVCIKIFNNKVSTRIVELYPNFFTLYPILTHCSDTRYLFTLLSNSQCQYIAELY